MVLGLLTSGHRTDNPPGSSGTHRVTSRGQDDAMCTKVGNKDNNLTFKSDIPLMLQTAITGTIVNKGCCESYQITHSHASHLQTVSV